MPGKGLYANIAAKRRRIKAQKAAGKKTEKMRKPGTKGAPTAKAFRAAAKTAKKKTKKK
jgi:cysteine sulfinate desulfinase/cysteine desulfurase-like protein